MFLPHVHRAYTSNRNNSNISSRELQQRRWRWRWRRGRSKSSKSSVFSYSSPLLLTLSLFLSRWLRRRCEKTTQTKCEFGCDFAWFYVMRRTVRKQQWIQQTTHSNVNLIAIELMWFTSHKTIEMQLEHKSNGTNYKLLATFSTQQTLKHSKK